MLEESYFLPTEKNTRISGASRAKGKVIDGWLTAADPINFINFEIGAVFEPWNLYIRTKP